MQGVYKKMGDELEKRVDDHEDRLRKLETNSLEMKYELLNINKSQSDLKTLYLEQGKEYTKQLDKFWEQMTVILKTKSIENTDSTETNKNTFIKLFFNKYEKLVIAIIVTLSALAGLNLSGVSVVDILTK